MGAALLDLGAGLLAGLVTVQQHYAGWFDLVPAAGEVQHVRDVRTAGDDGHLVQIEAETRSRTPPQQAGVHTGEQHLIRDPLDEQVVTADKGRLRNERT